MNNEVIGNFLKGNSEEYNYLVAVETDPTVNYACCIFHYPDGTKEMKKIEYEPWVWIKNLNNYQLFGGNSEEKMKAIKEHGIKVGSVLETGDNERLKNGYKYILSSTKSYNDIITFLKKGNKSILRQSPKLVFDKIKLDEQFLIQKKTRYFKGYESYDDIHRLYYDIETTGLNKDKDKIFFIGLKDNKGYQKVLVNTDMNSDKGEHLLMLEFFDEIIKLKPAVIAGYNSEMFDFDFIFRKLLKYNILGRINTSLAKAYGYEIPKGNRDHVKLDIRRIPQTLKLGGEQRKFFKHFIWGTNVLDVMFAVERAKAIDSEIKETGLKYITKYKKLNKPNRVYIEGGSIYQIYKDDNDYIINTRNSKYHVINDKSGNIDNDLLTNEIALEIFEYQEGDVLEYTTGKSIVEQYLIDDLYETEQVDRVFNEEAFSITKLLPVTYHRKAIMGTAGKWNLLMSAWSYENGLAIPYEIKKTKFTGGLSRVFKIGFIDSIQKFDFAGLYPSIKLAHNLFPSCDITEAIKGFLWYFVTERNKFKVLAEDKSLSEAERSFYKSKQLPFKIFNNSNFGAEGSEFFNWAEMDIAESVTCYGRQYLRKMVHFFSKYDCIPLVLDTDGINMSVPEFVNRDINGVWIDKPVSFDTLEYKGNFGVTALITKFNEMLPSPMKVDDDGKWLSTINIMKKNYVCLLPNGKVKMTGNTLKSTNLPKYQANFLMRGVELLLAKKTRQFVDEYYELIRTIAYNNLDKHQVSSKAKVKDTLEDYICRGTDKNGKLLSSKAHMELIMREVLTDDEIKDIESKRGDVGFKEYVKDVLKDKHNPYQLGNFVYYYNIGTAKSHGDVSKKGNIMKINAILIGGKYDDNSKVYNIEKVLQGFITRISALFVVFNPEVRKVLEKCYSVKKTKGLKTYQVLEREFTDEDLTMGLFDKDDINRTFYQFEEKELKYWIQAKENKKLIEKTGITSPRQIFEHFVISTDNIEQQKEEELENEEVEFEVEEISSHISDLY